MRNRGRKGDWRRPLPRRTAVVTQVSKPAFKSLFGGGHGPTKSGWISSRLGCPFFALGMGGLQGAGLETRATTAALRRGPRHCAHLRACPLPAPPLLPLKAVLVRGSLARGSLGARQASAVVAQVSKPAFKSIFWGGCGPTKMSNEEAFGSDFRLGCPFFTLGMG
jgi:hypothetical protein